MSLSNSASKDSVGDSGGAGKLAGDFDRRYKST